MNPQPLPLQFRTIDRDPGKSVVATLARQQRRRLRFIEANRLSPQEVADHIAWDYDPGPEYDDR